ncbi:kinase-like protein, partial [Aureobasidium melanogenum]
MGNTISDLTSIPLPANTIATSYNRKGNYVVQSMLGIGLYGIVYRVTHPQSMRLFAMKVLQTSTSAQLRRFREEATILATLSYPNIAVLEDIGGVPDPMTGSWNACIVTELADYNLLHFYSAYYSLGISGLDEALAQTVAHQFSSALTYLHDQNFVHRDIKPANILVFWTSRSSLLFKRSDFGLAAHFLEDESVPAPVARYTAPELLLQGHDPQQMFKVDVWALGMLMVMSYLNHPPTLYAMAQVNTTWAAYAVDRLWAHPPQRALTLLAVTLPKSRRQFLANKVQSLSLHKDQFALQAMDFGSLRSLSFGQYTGPDLMDHALFIQPSLRSLSYYGDHTFTGESINLVYQRCPDLHSLLVSDPFLVNSALFVRLLQTRRRLKSLALGHKLDYRIIDDVLACLIGPISQKLKDLTIRCPLNQISTSHLLQFVQSTRVLRKLIICHPLSNASELLSALCGLDTLEKLELGHWFTSEQLAYQDQQQSNTLPFRKVQNLSLHGDAQALSRLLCSRSITSLALNVEHPDESFYTAIGSMMQLTSLDLTLPPSENVDQEGLRKLRMLRKLRRFNMSKSIGDDLEDMLQLPWMTDCLFEEFFASYPLLEQLYLDWDLSDQLTEGAIGGLAKSCPRYDAYVETRSRELVQTQATTISRDDISWLRQHLRVRCQQVSL